MQDVAVYGIHTLATLQEFSHCNSNFRNSIYVAEMRSKTSNYYNYYHYQHKCMQKKSFLVPRVRSAHYANVRSTRQMTTMKHKTICATLHLQLTTQICVIMRGFVCLERNYAFLDPYATE